MFPVIQRRLFLSAAACLIASFAGAGFAQPQPAPLGGPITAVVSIPPLVSIVRDVLPKGSKVESLIPPGVSEHGFEIPPTKLAALAKADLVVTVGLGIEPQVTKYLKEHPKEGRREVCFADVVGVEEHVHEGEGHSHEGHSHGDDDASKEACEHGVDPHLWFDAAMMKQLATAVHAAAGSTVPGQLLQVHRHIDDMDARYRTALLAAKRRVLIVAHDAWGRLAARYAFDTIAIAGLNAGEPSPKAIADAANAAKTRGVTAVAVEPQLSQDVARRIAKGAGLKVVTLDPLGDGDWTAMMERNLAALAEALGAPVPAPATPR